jgi:hypothetical protein
VKTVLWLVGLAATAVGIYLLYWALSNYGAMERSGRLSLRPWEMSFWFVGGNPWRGVTDNGRWLLEGTGGGLATILGLRFLWTAGRTIE